MSVSVEPSIPISNVNITAAKKIAAEERDVSTNPPENIFNVEPLVEKLGAEPSAEKPGFMSFIRKSAPKWAYALSSVFHGVAALNNMTKFLSPKLKKFLDTNSVRFTKGITSVIYFFLSLEALKHNRIFDFFARILDPLLVPWMGLSDIHLARGMSAGLTQIDISQNKRVKANPKSKTKLGNLIANFKAFKEMLTETLDGGFGKHRKIFVPKEKESGHTMALTGYLIMLGSFLGIAFGANQRNFMNKLGGLIRNLGGFIGDFTMIMHSEPDNQKSGFFYATNAVIDALQRFLPEEVAETINHLNMILNNIGTYYFGRLSQKRTDGTFKD